MDERACRYACLAQAIGSNAMMSQLGSSPHKFFFALFGRLYRYSKEQRICSFNITDESEDAGVALCNQFASIEGSLLILGRLTRSPISE
jgi:hypothetical protein